MTSITLYNKGKRTWTDLVNSAGDTIRLPPEGSIEMEEAAGLRMLVDYPREFTSSKIAGPSSEDLARREQSIRDREANLDKREKALKEKEDQLAATIQLAIVGEKTGVKGIMDIVPATEKRGPGRPAKNTEGA